MFTNIFDLASANQMNIPKEGDLYKTIELHGVTFEIRYGYYEDIDRLHEPIEIYPDFIRNPVYTNDGFPFITLMQAPCEHYKRINADPDRDCGNCKYMERGDELIALCRCPKNRKTDST